uniref:Rho GTPase-activating protein 11A-like n=1 Tax=Petromyzon marinus TaxID=7757 RepID=A0AAJ7X4D3_PETMA|nr:rho GTPase-activating protein 11A-like [Petromyzon marinus]
MRDHNVGAAARLQLRSLGVRVEAAARRPKGRAGSGKKKEDYSHGGSPSSTESLVPRFVLEACRYLQDHLDTEGIFRKPGSLSRMRELKARLERGEACLAGATVNDVAGLLKQHLREAAEPLVPRELHSSLRRAQQLATAEERTRATLLLCLLMPPATAHTLRFLMTFLHSVAERAEDNKMTATNLAVVFTPTLMHGGRGASLTPGTQQLLQLQVLTVETLIANAPRIGQWPDEEEVEEDNDDAAGADFGRKGSEDQSPSTGGRGDQRSLKLNRRRSFNDVVYGALNRLKISKTPVGTPKGEDCVGPQTPLTGRQKRKSSDVSPNHDSSGKKRRGDEVWDSTPRGSGHLDTSQPSAGDSSRYATRGSDAPSLEADGAAVPPGEATTTTTTPCAQGGEGAALMTRKRSRMLLGLSAPHPSRTSARLRLRMTKPRAGSGPGDRDGARAIHLSSSSGPSDGSRKSLRVMLSHLKAFGSEERATCYPLKSSAEVGRRLANQPRLDGGMDTLRIFPQTPRRKPAPAFKPPVEAGPAGLMARSGGGQGSATSACAPGSGGHRPLSVRAATAGSATAPGISDRQSHRGPLPVAAAASPAISANLTPDPCSDAPASLWNARPSGNSLCCGDRVAPTAVRIKGAFFESGNELHALAFKRKGGDPSRAGGDFRNSESKMSSEAETAFEKNPIGGRLHRPVPGDDRLGPTASNPCATFYGGLNRVCDANQSVGQDNYQQRDSDSSSLSLAVPVSEVSEKRLPAPSCSNADGSAITQFCGCGSCDLKGQKNPISTPSEILKLDTFPGYKHTQGSQCAGVRLIPAALTEASKQGLASEVRKPAKGISRETLLSEPDWCWDADAIKASSRASSCLPAGRTVDTLFRSSSAEMVGFGLQNPALRLVKASSAEACPSGFDDETARRRPPRMTVTSFVGAPMKLSVRCEEPSPPSNQPNPRGVDVQTVTGTMGNSDVEREAGDEKEEVYVATSGQALRSSPGDHGNGRRNPESRDGRSTVQDVPLHRSVSTPSRPVTAQHGPHLRSGAGTTRALPKGDSGGILKSVSFNAKGSRACGQARASTSGRAVETKAAPGGGRLVRTGRPLQVPPKCPVAPMPFVPSKAAWDV